MTNSKILRDEFHRINGTDPDNGLDIPKYLLWLEDRAVLPQANVIKSVCDKCRFENECRFKAENIEQNCKFFIDKQTVL